MKNDDINIKDVKIKLGGTELTEFDGDKVLCLAMRRFACLLLPSVS